jgi:tripartite-type tricarboxylate transporter receptor subunit TctC
MTGFRLRLAFALVLALCAATAPAEEFPSRPVKIIVGQGTATTSDTLARLVGAKLSELWEQPVVIEPRSGAAGTIAAASVATAPADGYTLLLASSSNLGLAAGTGRSIPYDPVKDFAPIGRIAKVPWVLGANARSPAKSVADLIAYCKAHPGRLTAGSTGPGSAAWFGVETLKRMAGIDILNVPYRSSAPSIQALLTGEVDILFTDLQLLAPHVQAGTVRLLAAAGNKRLRDYPDLPTMAEQGIPTIVIEPWYGLVAPAGTPPEVLARLSASLRKALATSAVRGHIVASGYEPIDETPAEFGAAIAADVARFSAGDAAETKAQRKPE